MPKIGMPDIRKPQQVKATMHVIERVGLHGASNPEGALKIDYKFAVKTTKRCALSKN